MSVGGLLRSPQASTVCPTAHIFLAALTSRSWVAPQAGHVHSRTARSSVGRTCPQSKQRLELGYQRSILTRVRPYQAALYVSWRTSSPQPTSEMALVSL